jgi:hypothetical protein
VKHRKRVQHHTHYNLSTTYDSTLYWRIVSRETRQEFWQLTLPLCRVARENLSTLGLFHVKH